jgi:hypothetical protein
VERVKDQLAQFWSGPPEAAAATEHTMLNNEPSSRRNEQQDTRTGLRREWKTRRRRPAGQSGAVQRRQSELKINNNKSDPRQQHGRGAWACERRPDEARPGASWFCCRSRRTRTKPSRSMSLIKIVVLAHLAAVTLVWRPASIECGRQLATSDAAAHVSSPEANAKNVSIIAAEG